MISWLSRSSAPKERSATGSPNEYADFHELPYEDNRFDVWWCMLSVLHAVDKPKVVGEAFRVLEAQWTDGVDRAYLG